MPREIESWVQRICNVGYGGNGGAVGEENTHLPVIPGAHGPWGIKESRGLLEGEVSLEENGVSLRKKVRECLKRRWRIRG